MDWGNTWSPGGDRLAFQSNRNGDYDIYSINLAGSGVTPLTTDAADDTAPVWGYVLDSTPGDFLIEEQLGDCLSVTNILWGRDNIAEEWLAYEPGAPDFLQTLPELEPGGGYLINLGDFCTIDDGVNFIPMAPCWNLFGWMG